jgi:peptidyl-prolyl cis-trans isomerase D
MLSVLRQNANNWFMVLVFAAIGVTFVFTFGSWGGGNIAADMPVAATVNSKVIPQAEFHTLYANTFRNMQFYRPGYTPEQAKQEDLRGTVLDRLIQQELLAQAAEARGIVISDEMVVKTVRDRYFKDGKFDREEYRRIVNGVFQTTEARFEDSLKRELMARQLEAILTDGQQVSPAELKEAFDARYNRVNLEVLRIDPAFFAITKELDDATIAAFAADNGAKIEAFYNEHINRYRKQKQVKARHILIKAAEDASDADKADAKKRAEAALARVKGGEDFAKVASEVSEDGSKSAGGDLGFFGPGEMVGPFEAKAFAMAKDEISNVVETRFGYHVIKVEDFTEAEIKALDTVKNDIAKQLLVEARQGEKARSVAEKALADVRAGTALADLKIDGFTGNLREKNDNLAAPRVEETGWFNESARFVPRVGISDDVAKAGFALTDEAPVANQVFDVSGRLFVLRLKERELPDPSKFDAEKDQIETSLLSVRKSRVVDEFVKELKSNAVVEKNALLVAYSDS